MKIAIALAASALLCGLFVRDLGDRQGWPWVEQAGDIASIVGVNIAAVAGLVFLWRWAL